MAGFVAGDITYTMLNNRTLGNSRKSNRVKLVFGAGAETYSTGGIPLSKGKLGCPVTIESLIVVDAGGSGYRFMYDQTNEKLMMFVAPAQTHTHDIKALGSLTSSEPLLLDASGVFGKNAATNRTIAGANSATNGGVVSATLAASADTELANATDIATQTLHVEVIGW